jgi:hypothetical protein
MGPYQVLVLLNSQHPKIELDPVIKLEKLSKLEEQGFLSEEEFQNEKRNLNVSWRSKLLTLVRNLWNLKR